MHAAVDPGCARSASIYYGVEAAGTYEVWGRRLATVRAPGIEKFTRDRCVARSPLLPYSSLHRPQHASEIGARQH
eukprot:9046856-Pyramimonas_sp.AAC.1